MKAKGNAAIGVAWYRKEQWDKLLSVSEDCDKLESSYGEWLIEANLVLRRMQQLGLEVRKVDVHALAELPVVTALVPEVSSQRPRATLAFRAT